MTENEFKNLKEGDVLLVKDFIEEGEVVKCVVKNIKGLSKKHICVMPFPAGFRAFIPLCKKSCLEFA